MRHADYTQWNSLHLEQNWDQPISHSLLLLESHTPNKQTNQALLLPEGSVKLKSAVRDC